MRIVFAPLAWKKLFFLTLKQRRTFLKNNDKNSSCIGRYLRFCIKLVCPTGKIVDKEGKSAKVLTKTRYKLFGPTFIALKLPIRLLENSQKVYRHWLHMCFLRHYLGQAAKKYCSNQKCENSDKIVEVARSRPKNTIFCQPFKVWENFSELNVLY